MNDADIDDMIEKLCENSNHGTRKEDILTAFNAGIAFARESSTLTLTDQDRGLGYLIETCKCCGNAYKAHRRGWGDGWPAAASATPIVRRRPDGRYLAHSPHGAPLVLGVYGENEAKAADLFNVRIAEWRRTIKAAHYGEREDTV